MSDALVGVSVMPLDNRRDALVDVATTAERLGYDGYFLPETWAHDITVLMAEAALRTRRIVLGTGILGVWGRSAGDARHGGARRLAAISGGRFVLGLGASTAAAHRGAPRRAVRGADRPDAPHGDAGPGAAARRAHPARVPRAAPDRSSSTHAGGRAADLPGRAHRRVGPARRRAGRRLAAVHVPAPLSRPGHGAPARGRRASRRPGASARRDLPVGPDGRVRRSGRGARRGRLVRVVLPHDDGPALSPVARAAGIRARGRGGDRRQHAQASRARCRRRPRRCWRS